MEVSVRRFLQNTTDVNVQPSFGQTRTPEPETALVMRVFLQGN
jgi:hypothetical protein